MYPTVTSFRPPSGMRCDSRHLSSFITGALTATTVTLFLLRVVPGTYVVLPCDPTITARPVLMEEYLDRLDKHQEVFPDDESLIDTRPVHAPGAQDTFSFNHKKIPNPEKHQGQKKKKAQQEHQKQSKTTKTKTNNTSPKKVMDNPKDLQQQLKDLQHKEKLMKGSQWSSEPKEESQHKRKLQEQNQNRKLWQEQIQIKKHAEEIQLHLQQHSKNDKVDQRIEKSKEYGQRNERSERESKKRSSKTLDYKRSSGKKPYINLEVGSKTLLYKSRVATDTTKNPAVNKRGKREVSVPSSKRHKAHLKPLDSKLLQAIVSKPKEVNSEQNDTSNLYSKRYHQFLQIQSRENNKENILTLDESVTVPKIKQDLSRNTV